MKLTVPQALRTDFNGYNFFIDFIHATQNMTFDRVDLDFRDVNWIDANLVAVLGASIREVERELNGVMFHNLSNALADLLKRNHFLGYFGQESHRDYRDTTIKYSEFKPQAQKEFKSYLDRELLGRPNLPVMSLRLKKKINTSIFEAFDNAVIHANSRRIYSCGQYYPAHKRMDFTLVNLGRTIKQNVSDFFSTQLTGVNAIAWAVKQGNTTKKGDIPGGLGLSLIRDFLKLNGGKIQIISGDGFWEEKQDNVTVMQYKKEFPGTIVNLELNIADNSRYNLSTILNEQDIF